MTRTLLVPGINGSPEPHWQHWWAATDPTALTIEQREWADPAPEAWEAEIAGAILTHPDSILVAHSIGAVAAARVLSRWPQLRVRAALLVAPAEPRLSERLKRFAPLPDRPLGLPVIVAASRNDPWMSYTRSAALARAWGADLVDLGFAGHVNPASGFGPWPQGRELRDRLTRRGAVAAPAEAEPLCRALGWAF